MALVQKYVCDHCGRDIPDGSGRVRVELYREQIIDTTSDTVISPSTRARFDYHEACGRRATEFWDDLNVGRVGARGS